MSFRKSCRSRGDFGQDLRYVLLLLALAAFTPAQALAKTAPNCRILTFDGAAGEASFDKVTFRVVDAKGAEIDLSCINQVQPSETAQHFAERLPGDWGDGACAVPQPTPTPPAKLLNKTCGANGQCKHKYKLLKDGTATVSVCCYEGPGCKGWSKLGKTDPSRLPITVQQKKDPSLFFGPTPVPVAVGAAQVALDPIGLTQQAFRESQTCRDAVGKAVAALAPVITKTLADCHRGVMAGKLPPTTDCNSVNTGSDMNGAIAAAIANLSEVATSKCAPGGAPSRLGYPHLCPPPCESLNVCTAGTVGAPCTNDAGCDSAPGAGDGRCGPGGDWNQTVGCMTCVAEQAIAHAVADKYGTVGPGLSTEAQKCQNVIGEALTSLIDSQVSETVKCQKKVDGGKLGLTFCQKGQCSGPPSMVGQTCTKDDDCIAPSARLCKYADMNYSRAGAEAQAGAKLVGACSDATLAQLTTCSHNQAGLPVCVAQNARAVADALADVPYPEGVGRTSIPSCGDNVTNTLDEECDGTDDAACSGQCGSPTGPFPCLCLTIARERVIEHANADLDLGWTGMGHDARVVEGGGYVADLYDCDGPGGPDTLCTVGPSCSLPPHSACSSELQCAALGQGTCRKRRTAVGPHCNLNIQQPCDNDVQCTVPGDFCLKTFHGAPLPISGGGVSVCVVNVFSEDIVGIKELTTGDSAVRMRQRSITHLGPSMQQPCPVCGGFCADPPGGARNLCSTDADCGAGPLRGFPVQCTLDNICSFGPNTDKSCRPVPPLGGHTTYFGTTSEDCPPSPGLNISGVGIDVLFNPLTTGSTTFKPNIQCDMPGGFALKTCFGGPNEGRTCTADTQCTPGTCNYQCYCPTGGGTVEKPNACDAACVGGAFEGAPCAGDGECDPPNGFCHLGDCRINPFDPNGNNEGQCTSGPMRGICAAHAFKTCYVDGDCQGSNCTFCNPGELCVLANSQCFVNSGIIRTGFASPTDPTGVAAFCEAGTISAAINSTFGLPGPAAIRQPTHVTLTGFP